MTTSSSTTSTDPRDSLTLVEVKPGLKFSKAALQQLLPNVETALFFGKVYDLDAYQLGELLNVVLNTPLSQALLGEGGLHSTDLQDYVVDLLNHCPDIEEGDITFDPDVPTGEILPELWKQLEVEIADSIKAVAEKLHSVVARMPGKQGEMVFQSMRVLNAKRPILGDYKAKIHHAPQKQNLLILDVSGSMSQETVSTIVDDVVALAYNANAHLAIVSDSCFYWEPGTYDSASVLAKAQFSGTHYEQLTPLFDRDWGVVVTVADYDSSWDGKRAIAHCSGRIDEVIDVSLVNQPTFLAECVGQLADSVRPILIAAKQGVLGSRSYGRYGY